MADSKTGQAESGGITDGGAGDGAVEGTGTARASAKASRSRLEDFIDSSVSTFWEIDADYRFTFYSDRDSGDGSAGPSAFVLGRTLAELLGEKAHDGPWALHLADLAAQRTFREYRYSVETERGTRHLSSTGRPFYDGDGTFLGYRGVTHDVTELEEARRAAAHHASHDPLTDLGNRRFWNERLAEALRADDPSGALLLLDMDGFKAINDTLGHAAGDEVLCAVADAIRSVVRGGDVAARLGGDEFAVLLTEPVTRDTAGRIAARIMASIAENGLAGIDDPHSLNVSTSIGIAMIDAGDDMPGDVLRRADCALYEAKAAGKGVHAFCREGSGGYALH